MKQTKGIKFFRVEAQLFKWKRGHRTKEYNGIKNTDISLILTGSSWLFELGKVKALFFV